jgi:formate dehydrogenase subunit delta
MQNSDMIRMANQIAAYFEAYPRAEALAGIAKHIKSFWDPRMRRHLDAYIAEGGAELSPLVIAALTSNAKKTIEKAPTITGRPAAGKKRQPKKVTTR